jgi:hypothetical protein
MRQSARIPVVARALDLANIADDYGAYLSPGACAPAGDLDGDVHEVVIFGDPGVPLLDQAHPHRAQASCGISNFLSVGADQMNHSEVGKPRNSSVQL